MLRGRYELNDPWEAEDRIEACIDCGMNTETESYMVQDHVWSAGMPVQEVMSYTDYLCIGCIEARLGRELTAADFSDVPINQPSSWHSLRLNARLSGAERVALAGD